MKDDSTPEKGGCTPTLLMSFGAWELAVEHLPLPWAPATIASGLPFPSIAFLLERWGWKQEIPK
jgi:hypothetical protein